MAVAQAARLGLENFSILVSHVLVPPAMRAILDAPKCQVEGFLAAGHVSTVMGTDEYRPLAEKYRVPIVVTGFEPLDILQGVEMLLLQIQNGARRVEIQYRRGVQPQGNLRAREFLSRVFQVVDADWRGLGTIPSSGLKLQPAYAAFDAERVLTVQTPPPKEHKGCLCGEILRGVTTPPECPLFGTTCTPESPVGPCMVSAEGTCAGWYQYGSR